eukprot:7380597-Prymnesium_polylepis.1
MNHTASRGRRPAIMRKPKGPAGRHARRAHARQTRVRTSLSEIVQRASHSRKRAPHLHCEPLATP